MKKTIIIILLTFLFAGLGAYNTNMIIEHYSTEHGLPNNVVNCSLKDKDGFIWFGTWYGLCSFDGLKFRTYDKSEFDQTALPPRKIQRIVEDNNGFIWVKTIDRKLYIFNKKKEVFHAVFDDMKNYTDNIQLIKLQKNCDGDIILLTKDKNLLIAHTDEEGRVDIDVLFNSKETVDPNSYRLKYNVLSETADYISWIGLDYKILSYKKGESIRDKGDSFIKNKIAAPSDSAFTSIFNQGRKMWLGDNAGVFYCVDTQSGSVDKFVLSEIHGPISNIYVTSKGYAYLSVAGQGVYEYDIKERKLSELKIDVNENIISSAYMDHYDKIWFHENEKSLVYYDPQTKKSKRFPFTSQGKTGLLQIEDAGENGLFFLSPTGDGWLYDRNSSKMIEINSMKQVVKDESDQKFFHLFRDNEGEIWISSATNGVYRINFPRKQFRLDTFGPLLSEQTGDNSGVRALFQSVTGDIWLGTRNKKLYQLDADGNVKNIYNNQKHGIGVIYHIMEDKNGNIWFSTKGDGLIKAKPVKDSDYKFVSYKTDAANPLSLSGNDVFYTYQDSKQRIWVASLDGGLNLVEENNGIVSFKNKNNGFVNYPSFGLYMEVRNVVEDNSGRMWVGTMDGLMSFAGDFKSAGDISFEIYRGGSRNNYTDSDIYSLYKDSASNIWVSIFGGGLCRLTGYDEKTNTPEFRSYGLRDGLDNDAIISIVEDENNQLWFVTDKDISYYNHKTGKIRNYDKYDGFPKVTIEDNSAISTRDGEIWIGCKEGILSFTPHKLESHKENYRTFIVGCHISNRDIRSFVDDPIIDRSISYVDRLELKHKQSMFTFEFAALNFNNQNKVSYRYLLEGYEKEWHYNGKNRIASYTNVPPGEYLFKVQTLDESNPDLDSSRELVVVILPPWWASKWAYIIYIILGIIILCMATKLSMFMIRVKNDIYIEQRLSELKIKFFTNISHELRTPLTLITGPIKELKENENLSAKGKQYAELMERNVNHMLQLVNQILDFRKIQNGKMRLHVSAIDIKELVISFEREFRMLAEEKEISFSFHLPEETLNIWADKEKLGIVIRNILSNAFKFTLNGGSIFISVENDEQNNRCIIRIEDDGIGIPQHKQDEIFERFSQADNLHNAYHPGTGIGLALSKEIVNLHHGKIYVESENSKGSTFVIELKCGNEHYSTEDVEFYMCENTPACASDSANQENTTDTYEQEICVDRSLPSLLIVEDNSDLCEMMRLLLEDRFNIYIARDGVEGLKKIHLYHPDIVVTDQMMPNMDGL